MKFESPLLAVKDIAVSRRFYEEVLGLQMIVDHGRNIVLTGGLSLQQDFPEMLGLDPDSLVQCSRNAEMYFEEEDFLGFVEKLTSRGDIKLVHPMMEQPWGQRCIRFYDPDGHIIEVGEPMPLVVIRHLVSGMSPDQVSELTMCPLPIVLAARKNIMNK
ncbi:VOC family protein [Zongyangia hominis]|uniref:Glyoxalase/bleomycin resistance/dioxygenase family protein n=1 Tax=Zongyangia hominis TaxID=2763677 RepID=A0A926ICL6_9FIRM|nr:VOC family protein [Zongyangia hominis]MBC8571352.1 glyoxalase/bleomycin resistance/dioxygenase family protein [Zongyangia hominis]